MCIRMYVYIRVRVSVSVCLSRVYIMLLDGKVSHVAANIVTVVSVRVHTSGIIVAVRVAISITVHIIE